VTAEPNTNPEASGALPAARQKLFAVWIEFPPKVRLQGEGLLVVLANIVQSIAKRGDTRIVIGCASWSRNELQLLLRQHGVPESQYEVITGSKRIPILVRILRRTSEPTAWKKRPRGPLAGSLLAAVTRAFRTPILARALITDNWLVFLLALPLLIVLGLVGAVALVVLALLQYLKMIGTGFKRLKTRLKAMRQQSSWKNRRWFWALVAFPKAVMTTLKWPISAARAQLDTWLSQAYRLEFLRLAKHGKRKGVDVWYVANPGATFGLTEIKSPTVVTLADFVLFDFEFPFSRVWSWKDCVKAMDRLQTGAVHASATISFSNTVRDSHAVQKFQVPKERAFVVPHACPMLPTSLVADARQARSLIREYLRSDLAARLSWTSREIPGYIDNLDLGNLSYVFVSSQIRPHKNVMNMVRAMEELIRRRFISCKCVFSGNVNDLEALAAHVLGHSLQYDILSLPRIPSRHHAAFYRCARLAVVPTLFEGGFPFPFSEAMSVGTPVVMSRIPVVEEVIPEELGKVMLFDPYRPDDIADKIEWGLKNRDELIAMQRPIFERLSSRTWDQVASEYLGIVEQVRSEAAVG